MMDKRLLRQFRMAQGPHSNRTAKQKGQRASPGNGNKEIRTGEIRREGDRQIVFVAFVISAPAQQGGIPRSRSRL